MAVSAICPYCRTNIPLESTAPRVVCPRCGETVTVAQIVDDTHTVISASRPVTLTSPTWFKPAFFVSCVAALALLIGGLWWVYSGPPNRNDSPPTARTADGLVPPVALAGWGYIPGSAQVLVAVRPGPLVALGAATGTDARQRLAEIGIPQPIVVALDRLGVPLVEIDHLVVGLTLARGNAVPRVVASVVLVKPPGDEAAVLRAVGAERISGGERPRYKATLGGWPVQLVRAEPTVYVFATDAADLDGMEKVRPGNGEQLASALRDAMVNRLSPASFAWVVAAGHERWTELEFVQFVAKTAKREDLLPLLAGGRAAAVGLSLEPDPWLRIAVQTAETDALGDWFARHLAGERTVVEPAMEWVQVTTPCPLKELLSVLEKLIPPAKK